MNQPEKEKPKINYQPKGIVPKAHICAMYNFSMSTLSKILNVENHDKFKAIGYHKTRKFLWPKEYELFKELFGSPENLETNT